MNSVKIGIAIASAFTVLLCEAVIRKTFAEDTVASGIVLASYDKTETTPPQLVTEALLIIETKYLDGSFNGLDWQQVKIETLSRQYATSEEAYEAIDSVIERLGNHATRFLTPQQFASFSAENSGKEHIGCWFT